MKKTKSQTKNIYYLVTSITNSFIVLTINYLIEILANHMIKFYRKRCIHFLYFFEKDQIYS